MFKLNTPIQPDRAEEFYNFINPICSFLNLNPEIPLNIANYLLYESYRDAIIEHEITSEIIIDFLKNRSFLIDYIKNREYLSHLYNQPIICLVYYLIYIVSETTKERWFFTPDELITLFSDLGISSGLD